MKLRALTRSSRKHIRQQKARIRKETADPKLREQKIVELYAKFGKSLAPTP